MSAIAKRLSVVELSQQILEMAKTGVYRESVFEALHPMATKKQIRMAIAHAKKFGLHSVASLRDADLGTYYQVDLEKYRSLKHTIETSIVPEDDDAVVPRLVDATLTVRLMLATARGLAVGLFFLGVVCLFSGWQQVSIGLLVGAVTTTGLWAIQKSVCRKIIP